MHPILGEVKWRRLVARRWLDVSSLYQREKTTSGRNVHDEATKVVYG
jgi:hypothetical protein